jgi:hypothetical protein
MREFFKVVRVLELIKMAQAPHMQALSHAMRMV